MAQTTIKSVRTSLFLPYLALCLAIFGLGLSPLFIRWANAPGIVTSFYRMAIAVFLLAWPFFRQVRAKGWPAKRGVQIALFGGVSFAINLGCYATGILIGGVANPTMLSNIAPVWVGLGALIFFRERLPPSFWLGLLLVIVSALTILGMDGLKTISLGTKDLFGTSLGLFGGIFYGGYMLITQRGREYLDLLTYFWLATFSSMLTLLVFCLLLGYPLTGYGATTYLYFLAYGVVAQVFGYLAVNYALGHLPASIVSPSLLGSAVVIVLLAALVLDEPMTIWQAVGITGLLLGIYIVHHSRRQLAMEAQPYELHQS